MEVKLMKTIKRVFTIMALVLSVSMLLSGCSLFTEADDRPVCNLNDYVIIAEEGKSGRGTVRMDVDYEAILEDFGQYVEYEAIEEIPEWLSYGIGDGDAIDAINALFYGVELDDILRSRTFNMVLSQSTNLANGDVVTVRWTDSPIKRDALSKLLPIKFVYADFTYMMEKLDK
jgi:hypothetical protein